MRRRRDDLLCPADRSPQLLPYMPRCACRPERRGRNGRCRTIRTLTSTISSPPSAAFPIDRMLQPSSNHGHQLALAGWFGEQLATIVADDACGLAADLVVPMPLHSSRMRSAVSIRR